MFLFEQPSVLPFLREQEISFGMKTVEVSVVVVGSVVVSGAGVD